MNTRDLQIFIKIADYRSITRTAEDLQMTQPAISSALKRLEEELGYPLFIRRGKWLLLNSQGELFYHASKDFLAEIDHMKSGLQLNDHQKKEIVIKMYLHSDRLYELLGSFTEENPDIRVTLQTGVNTGSESYRTSDFHVLLLPDRDESDDFLPLEHRGGLYAILPVNHPFASYTHLTIDDLRDEKYVFQTVSDSAGIESVYHACISAGFTPKISVITSGKTSKFAAIRKGCGIGLAYDNALSLAPLIKDCRVIPVEFPLKISWLGLAWKPEELTEAAERFLAFAKENV